MWQLHIQLVTMVTKVTKLMQQVAYCNDAIVYAKMITVTMVIEHGYHACIGNHGSRTMFYTHAKRQAVGPSTFP